MSKHMITTLSPHSYNFVLSKAILVVCGERLTTFIYFYCIQFYDISFVTCSFYLFRKSRVRLMVTKGVFCDNNVIDGSTLSQYATND